MSFLLNTTTTNPQEMRLVALFFLLAIAGVLSKPYPVPVPEPVFPCTTNRNDTTCGNNAECKLINGEHVCECKERFGTLPPDTSPCTQQRTSKALAFWLQMFFGWLNVGAFVMHWWWFASSIFITYAIWCCFQCCFIANSDDNHNYTLSNKCCGCMAGCVVVAMWVTNLVYISGDECYSVVQVDKTEYALKCWENM